MSGKLYWYWFQQRTLQRFYWFQQCTVHWFHCFHQRTLHWWRGSVAMNLTVLKWFHFLFVSIEL